MTMLEYVDLVTIRDVLSIIILVTMYVVDLV